MGAFLRNRRFGSYFDATSGPSTAPPRPMTAVKEAAAKKKTDEDYRDDDGWFSVLISWVRIVICFLSMMFTTFVWAMIMVVLLPWPYQRIRQGNIYGHVTGKMLVSSEVSWFILMNILLCSVF